MPRFQTMTDQEVLELLISKKYYTDLKTGNVFNNRDHKLKPFVRLNGGKHLFVALFKDGKYRRGISVHRLVWMDYNKQTIPTGWHIHHIDEDPENNAFENLLCVHPEDHKKLHRDQYTDEVPF